MNLPIKINSTDFDGTFIAESENSPVRCRGGHERVGSGNRPVGVCALPPNAGGNQIPGGRSQMRVPKGQLRIAQRFNAGLASPNFIESRRDDRKCSPQRRILFRPFGAFSLFVALPTVETVGYFLPPLRGSKQGAAEPADLGMLESRSTLFRQRMERHNSSHKEGAPCLCRRIERDCRGDGLDV